VSAYASFGRMNGIGSTIETQRQRMDLTTNEPQFTNCTRDFLGSLDYIFYTGKTHLHLFVIMILYVTLSSLLQILDNICLQA
jgi:CCR4-NOT transcription complex subunit 6